MWHDMSDMYAETWACLRCLRNSSPRKSLGNLKRTKVLLTQTIRTTTHHKTWRGRFIEPLSCNSRPHQLESKGGGRLWVSANIYVLSFLVFGFGSYFVVDTFLSIFHATLISRCQSIFTKQKALVGTNKQANRTAITTWGYPKDISYTCHVGEVEQMYSMWEAHGPSEPGSLLRACNMLVSFDELESFPILPNSNGLQPTHRCCNHFSPLVSRPSSRGFQPCFCYSFPYVN